VIPKPNPANTLPPRPETFYFEAKLDIMGQGMGGVCVQVDTEGVNEKAPVISIMFDEALRPRSGLRLTMNLSAVPVTVYGAGYTVKVLEKNTRYKYTGNQEVDIGGEFALEWNYCADVHNNWLTPAQSRQRLQTALLYSVCAPAAASVPPQHVSVSRAKMLN